MQGFATLSSSRRREILLLQITIDTSGGISAIAHG
jgi:hypothetical protein